jgi:flavin-dependent dehydrogenase
MADPRSIRIVGGGLAGLTLGIALRQRHVPVTVVEAGCYPRHRVCGEFISGRGLATLARLDLKDQLLQAGGRWARSVAFYVPGKHPIQQLLPQPALCLSRYLLDDLLAKEFCRLGGELRHHERWTESYAQEGVVRTTGRQVQPSVLGWRWFGLKVHVRGVVLQADLEMHLRPDGYVGLCWLQDEVNVCGLFRSRTPRPELARQWQNVLRGEPGSELRARLGGAVFDEDSFSAVSGLCPAPRRASDGSECRLGDALTMIPPVTGNGMSLAFESAELAVDPLISYSLGACAWDVTQEQIAQKCSRRFGHRLQSAVLLHRALFHPVAKRLLLSALLRFPRMLRVFFRQTR